MFDINQAIAHRVDPAGNFEEALAWSEDLGREIAVQEGISLTDAHWDVIRYLRDYYRECGMPPSGTRLMRCLEDQFAEQGGKRYLYQLFPGGPVTQSCKIGGLPPPPYSSDRSFGSVQ